MTPRTGIDIRIARLSRATKPFRFRERINSSDRRTSSISFTKQSGFPGKIVPFLFAYLPVTRLVLGRPYFHLLIEGDGSRMIRHGEICDRLSLFGPLLEKRVFGLEFPHVFPPRLDQREDGLLAHLGGAYQVKRISEDVGVAFDTRHLGLLHNRGSAPPDHAPRGVGCR